MKLAKLNRPTNPVYVNPVLVTHIEEDISFKGATTKTKVYTRHSILYVTETVEEVVNAINDAFNAE